MNLDHLFRPRGIAVVGASATPTKAGAAAMAALAGFPGRLYPVNPRPGSGALPSVAAIGEPVDLALLVVPPDAVPAALTDCAKAGVLAAIVCAGGFGEVGPDGAARQAEAVAIAASHGIRLLGPNTSGFVNPVDRVFATFVPTVTQLPAGPAAIVAQSGGVNLALCFEAAAEGLGVRLGVGLGNAADVGFVDVLTHLAADPSTRAVGLHVEGVADGRALCEAVSRVAATKPVVALKVGRSDVSDFARSHTGALTGDYALTRAALAQAGAVVVDDPTELIDALRALCGRRLPPRPRPGVGLVTGQAGPGLIAADLLRSRGVSLPPLSPTTTGRLAELLPPLTYQSNPVDTGRPEATFPDVLAAVAADPSVDLLAVYALDEPGAVDLRGAVRPLDHVVVGSGGLKSTMDSLRVSLGPDVALFRSPDRLARAVAALVTDAAAQSRLERSRLEQSRLEQCGPGRGGELKTVPLKTLPPGALDEDVAKQVLAAAGVRVPARVVCHSRAEAEVALATLGPPVVVKVLDAAVAHKSDVGGVHVNVRTLADLHVALGAICAHHGPTRYLVEEQAPPGPELIVGGLRDASFGPVVMLALGGVAVSLTADPILRLAPLDRDDAVAMVRALPPALLAGYRGAAPVDVDALAEVILAVATVLTGFEDVAEIDVNPVRLTDAGLPLALDAWIVRGPLAEAAARMEEEVLD